MRICSFLTLVFTFLAALQSANAAEQLVTFENEGFSNHLQIEKSLATSELIVSIISGGSNNFKEVLNPAAIYIGFQRANPVTEVGISPASAATFRVSSIGLTNQFAMSEPLTISAWRSDQKVAEVLVDVPWPSAQVKLPSDGSFSNLTDVRLSGTDIYFYLEDVTFDLDSDGDGFIDSEDQFPDDPNEWVDKDNNGIGDNKDKTDRAVILLLLNKGCVEEDETLCE